MGNDLELLVLLRKYQLQVHFVGIIPVQMEVENVTIINFPAVAMVRVVLPEMRVGSLDAVSLLNLVSGMPMNLNALPVVGIKKIEF